ncbi:hypothetical protein LguiA_000300 [Lonicera macranthoides]
MRTGSLLLQLFLTLILLTGVVKPDIDPLQDYCIADTNNPQTFFCNGVPCINPALAKFSHFGTSALSKPGNTQANPFGFNVTLTNTLNLPGFNTLGLAMARVDIAAKGLVPPHAHPRASEVNIFLSGGTLLVGFVNTSNHLFAQKLNPGDLFVFPKGLIHFLYNIDSKVPALVVSGLSSQNPGAQIASLATFASRPAILDEILKKAFKINSQDVTRIRKNLGG